MFVPNHVHVLVKGYIDEAPKSEERLNQWFKDLVKKVRMVVVAGPTSVYVDEPGNEGLTGTVTLATSHASIHIWDSESPALFQFDLYSCSNFEVSEIIEHLDEFSLASCEWMYIDRNDGIKIVNQGTYKRNNP